MSQQVTWSRHYQNIWQERAGDPNLPDWLRVACLAYGNHRANGHAMFGPGSIGLVLARVDPTSGEIKPLMRQNVQRAINKAIEYSWLGEGSTTRCLVVPAHHVSGGLGRPDDTCPQHAGRPTARPARELRLVQDTVA